MLQEMKLEDALKKFLQGKKVLVMYDESLKNDGTEFIVEALEKMLERNRYLVDVPAIEDFEFKQEVEQMVKTEKSSTKAVKKKLVDLPKNKSKLDDCQEEIIQMSVSRAKKAGRYHLMQAENPVFILSGKGDGHAE